MSQLDDYKNKIKFLALDDLSDDAGEVETGDTGEGSQGGAAGEIRFKEFISLGEKGRDDLLTGEDRRRLLAVHETAHEADVKLQKETRDQRKAVKEGKVSLAQYRDGLSKGQFTQYKSHPMLSAAAQFSGTDRQINALPTENLAETNQDKRNELQYQYNLVHRPEHAPKFNPKPIMNR